MAFAGRSPTRTYAGPGSPTAALHAYTEPQTSNVMYGPQRPMLPPSPQHYQPRFPATTLATTTPSLPSLYDSRTNPLPHKRPGSSMSISSMLGGEPERLLPEGRVGVHSRTPSQPAPSSTSAGNFMSPPHFQSKSSHGDYSYKPRSRTPDKFGTVFAAGPTRQRSSSSGTAIHRPGMFDEPRNRSAASTPAGGLHDPFVTPIGMGHDRTQDDRARRTSLSGVLQRPNSQPQSGGSLSQGLAPYQIPAPTVNQYDQPPLTDVPKQNGIGSSYDTKPPAMNGLGRSGPMDEASPTKSLPPSLSPEVRRPSLNGLQSRGLANLLNGPTSQPTEPQSAHSQRMVRQDSAQSQSDRSVLGERTKFRAYSPFNTSFTSNPDDAGRKGSDDLSQHRAILGLAQENKRGRYSPLPQAVQGAQAQSPVPDAGAKSDRGRVFSGIGGGVGTTPTPSSPFKKDEPPLKLSEDNLKSLGRSTSGTNKRSRKIQDDDHHGNGSSAVSEKPTGRKRGKHQHNYKADLEEMAQAGFPAQTSSMTGPNSFKASSAAAGAPALPGYYHPRNLGVATLPRHRKVIHVSNVFDAASRMTRRHLGNFTYCPNIAQADSANVNDPKFNIAVTPNLLPSFDSPANVNCTYTVHVPRLWLQPREKALISAGHNVWGSGIYTDDSDPVAAAMHAGFLKPEFSDGADASLLEKIVREQNPQVEFPSYVTVPSQPLDVVNNKDLKITLVVLPLLERYEGSNRFGIRSRTWPEAGAKTPHDGVSFGVLNVELVDTGVEELRVGRTGQSRRMRLQTELEARRRGLKQQRKKIEAARQRRVDQLQQKISHSARATPGLIPKSVPSTTLSERQTDNIQDSSLQAQAVRAAA